MTPTVGEISNPQLVEGFFVSLHGANVWQTCFTVIILRLVQYTWMIGHPRHVVSHCNYSSLLSNATGLWRGDSHRNLYIFHFSNLCRACRPADSFCCFVSEWLIKVGDICEENSYSHIIIVKLSLLFIVYFNVQYYLTQHWTFKVTHSKVTIVDH